MRQAVDTSLAHDSDITIKFTIDHGLKEIENPLGIKYSMTKVDRRRKYDCNH